jgi:DNA-binding CsgD family transcriptional regulator
LRSELKSPLTPELKSGLREVLRTAPPAAGGSRVRHKDMAAAVALYEVAAARGSGRLADISAQTGLDEACAAAGWRTLKDMGLVRVADGQVETVEPDTALAVLMGRYTANVHEQLQSALAVNDATQKLLTVFQPAVSRRQQPVVVDQFAGPESRERALHDITAGLRESADSLHQGPMPDDRAALDRSLEMDAGLALRGIRVRALYPRALLSEAKYAVYLRELSVAGITVRVIDHVAHDMLIFDRHTVCLPGGGSADPLGPAMIRIRGTVLVQSFTSIYESYWQRATPLSLAGARPHHAALSDRERAVIRLMTNGYGDDRIARKLGIELRVVEDVMAALMERLGAGSRFEVGYKLARELDPRDL